MVLRICYSLSVLKSIITEVAAKSLATGRVAVVY
jgi:hypothetical protein